MYRLKTFILLLSLIVLGCEKEEIPITPHEPGDIITNQVEMGSNYVKQLFYDLGTNSLVSENNKTDWDIAFESDVNGWHIILNSSRGGAAANTNTTDFLSVTTTDAATWSWDVPSGNLDSTAIGDYRYKGIVYIIDRGYNSNGNHTGYKKIVIDLDVDSLYKIRVADLDGTGDTLVSVVRDIGTNFTCFSFDNNETIYVEPEKDNWDLVFTQYLHIFQNPLTPYLVTGVQLNRNNVSVAIDTVNKFSEITHEDVSTYNFGNELNKIGYNWKFFDFNTSTYSIIADKNFIINDTEGRVFKFHFIDFYNNNGDKGAPKFEIQEL